MHTQSKVPDSSFNDCLAEGSSQGQNTTSIPTYTMKAKWIIGAGILVAIGGLCLLWTQMFQASTGVPGGREEIIGEIIRNWQEAHPADRRFVTLPMFNKEAVLDKETGLVWELSPHAAFVTWNEARAVCLTRGTGGQKGWRLPAPSEMRSLVGPAVDAPGPNLPPGHPFLNVQPTSYWTVVPEANQPTYARYLDAFLGNVLSLTKIYTFPVWCVRGPVKMDE